MAKCGFGGDPAKAKHRMLCSMQIVIFIIDYKGHKTDANFVALGNSFGFGRTPQRG
jgi:hypothetical protein